MRQPFLAVSASTVAFLLAIALSVGACASSHPRRDPVGETFPAVQGESLEGEAVALPADLGGEPAVLLIGFVQDAQFDLDRWILGLLQAETPIRVLEVPTIPGLVPRMIAGTIDDGMRSGIPEEDWRAVVTLYGGDAKAVARLTGDEGRNGRVLLLDGEGQVRWSHDRGYSAGVLLELDRAARELLADPPNSVAP